MQQLHYWYMLKIFETVVVRCLTVLQCTVTMQVSFRFWVLECKEPAARTQNRKLTCIVPVRDVSCRQISHLSTYNDHWVLLGWPYCQRAQCGCWFTVQWSTADLLTSSHPQISASKHTHLRHIQSQFSCQELPEYLRKVSIHNTQYKIVSIHMMHCKLKESFFETKLFYGHLLL